MEKVGYVSPYAIHPGETIKEAITDLGMSQVDLAARVDLSTKTISLILSGDHPITPESAIKLERALGVSHKTLLQMQAFYDADKFRLEEMERLAEEAKHLEKYRCYTELVALGYVKKTRDQLEKVDELLRFFGVNSLVSLESICPVAFRRSVKNDISYESLAAWLRIGNVEAQKIETAEFNKDVLRSNIEKMRELTSTPVELYSKALVKLCAEAGVALIYTPHLKKTCVNGATQWISPTKAMVQVSLYYSYADIFWFTLFHELGHVLKHSKKEAFINFEKSVLKEISSVESEADLFAQRTLIPVNAEKDYQKLKESITPSSLGKSVQAFANSIGIDPGIVAGRLGRELGIWRYVSPLRKKLQFTNH